MNVVDVMLIAIVLMSIWSGWRRGFIIGILELLVLFACLFIAFTGYQYLAEFIEGYLPGIGVWTMPLSFLIIFLLSRILLGLIVRMILRTISTDTHNHFLNQAGGIFPGVVNGLIYATIIAAILLSVPFFQGLSDKAQESRFAGKMAEGVEWLDNKFSPVFDNAVKRTMNKMTVDPNSQETVNLSFKVENPKVRADLEQKMLALVNEERTKRGLKPLQWDSELVPVARDHSRDMFGKGYFSHVNLEGQTPSDRIREGNVRFLTAGENLALAPTLTLAHRGLMNSPGHKANILHESYGRVGIGIMDGGIRGLMVTQNFRN